MELPGQLGHRFGRADFAVLVERFFATAAAIDDAFVGQ
jgi:hypothetical protein